MHDYQAFRLVIVNKSKWTLENDSTTSTIIDSRMSQDDFQSRLDTLNSAFSSAFVRGRRMRQAVTIAFAPVFILLIVACVFFADQVYTSTNGAPFIIIGIVSAVAGIFLLFYAKKSTDEALRRSEEIVRGFALEDAGLGVNWVFVKERIGQDSDDFRYWIEVRVSNDRPDVRQTRAFSRMEVDSPLHPKIVVTIE